MRSRFRGRCHRSYCEVDETHLTVLNDKNERGRWKLENDTVSDLLYICSILLVGIALSLSTPPFGHQRPHCPVLVGVEFYVFALCPHLLSRDECVWRGGRRVADLFSACVELEVVIVMVYEYQFGTFYTDE
ncbi:unnamed protein product [Sphenostylis stenocarpa]|uniref:Uncharacterized protein n=1 Tax=Sphenostylis stenocarpa TaxID=92480 RepID=A0AA86THW1_9FABA|nr:unnamed protein product [Sphenostylis stenocarpa]